MNNYPLEPVGKDIWIINYPFKLIGANFGNKMTVIKYDDDKLLLHSPIPICPQLIEKIDTLGQVKLLMAPNLMHNLFINEWKQHYNDATLMAPKHIKKVDYDISLEEITLSEKSSINIPSDFRIQFIAGMNGLHEYALIHIPSGTLVLTDLAFNIHNVKGIWSNIFFRLYGAYGKFGPTHLIKAIIKNKVKFSQSINTILSYDFDKIIVSHGDLVMQDGKSYFSKAFSHIK